MNDPDPTRGAAPADPDPADDPRATRPKVEVPGVGAPIFSRFAAYALDCALLAAVLMPLHFLAMRHLLGGERPEWTRHGVLLWLFVLATYSLPVWLYFALLESREGGATLGKRLLRMRVVDREGRTITRGAAWLRTAVKLLPWEILHASLMLPIPAFDADHADVVKRPGMTIQFFLVASWVVTVLVTEGHRAVHDFLAGTFVIRRGTARTPTSSGDTVD